MPRIFVSYKRVDKEKVFPIIEKIKHETGADCWIDLEGIESGDHFQNVIIDAIDNADMVVCMLSKNFIAPYRDEITGDIDIKKQTFTEKEVMYALRENKRVIPISLDGTTVNDCKWLKFNCAGIDCIDWSKNEQKDKLLKNIRRWSEPESKLPNYPSPPIPPRNKLTIAWLTRCWWHTCTGITITTLFASIIYTLLSPNRLYINVEGFPEDSIPLISSQVQSNAQELRGSANAKIKGIMSENEKFSNIDMEDREKKLDSLIAENPLNTFSYATYTDSHGAIRWIRNIFGKKDVDIELRRGEELISVSILPKDGSVPLTYRTKDLEKAIAFIVRLYSPVTSILYDYIPPQNVYNNSNAWSGTLYTDSEREEMMIRIKNDEHESFYYQFIEDNIKDNPSVNTNIIPQKVLKLNPDIAPNCKQLLVVHDMQIIKSVYKASFCYFEKQGDTWNMIESPFTVNLGIKGIADFEQKREGDNMVPSGCYTIHEAFGYDEEAKTKLDYKVVNDNHIWITDPNDSKYNMMIEDIEGHYIGMSPADTYETLRRKKNGKLDFIYKYVIVIDYNCNPVVKGNGSAIFIHLERSAYNSTAGCIAMPEDKIIKLMQWLDKSKHPYIYITKEMLK